MVVLLATLSCVSKHSTAGASPLASPTNIPTSTPVPGFIVLTQPMKLKIAYGETTLPAGMRLPVVSSDAVSVQVKYMGETHVIPIAGARFENSTSEPVHAQPEVVAANASTSALEPSPGTAPHVRLSLQSGYDARMQGGDITMRELQLLLSPYCEEGVDLEGAGTKIYNGLSYLMGSDQAAATLGLGHAMPSRVPVATPGFPRNCTYYIGYDGAFDGRFNRLYLVTDIANRLVAVQLVDEHPNFSSGRGGSNGRDWNTYNFLNARLRASDAMRVHATSTRDGNAIVIETRLSQAIRQRKGRGSVNVYEEKEHTKLFLPIPFARIILHCAHVGLSKT